MDKYEKLEIEYHAENDSFSIKCFDDDTCKNIEDMRDAWIAMGGIKFSGRYSVNNVAEYICKLFLNGKNAGDMRKILLNLAEQCVQSLTSLQKETLLKAHAWNELHNSIKPICSKQEILKYYFAKNIAYEFWRDGEVLYLFEDKKMDEIYEEYEEYYKEIANEYYRLVARDGRLVLPYRDGNGYVILR